ncbi:MAG: type II CAAX endopeptidase family protein, partial [Balneolaceae bacterium]|nr:type II CAAX endopeptidase family protein [Balneolaceae bacterium]
MNTNRERTEKSVLRLLLFFLLSFVIAWGIWIPVGTFAPDLYLMVLPGAWAPTIAAFLLAYFTDGREGLRKLLGKLIRWRVSIGYYLFAIFAMPVLSLAASALHALLGGKFVTIASVAAQFGIPEEQSYLFLVYAPLIYLTTVFAGGPIAEEVGWRGYAQPLLQQKIGAGRAGLLIGFIWGFWHLPLFCYFPQAVGNIPLVYYVPLVTAYGVLFAWIYNKTGGSVLLCILLHAGINFSVGVVGSEILAASSKLLTLV